MMQRSGRSEMNELYGAALSALEEKEEIKKV